MTKKMSEQAFNLSAYLKRRKELINSHLSRVLPQEKDADELTAAMSYCVMAGGKRLRPILCLAAAECVEGDMKKALPAACAIEMIHTYSLVHDDLPAMDNDDMRRGKPTCHRKFSESTAILAGDALLTEAFTLLSRPQTYFDAYPGKDTLLEISGILSDAAGRNGMVMGQVMDMASGKTDPENKTAYLKKMHRLKTGHMIKASVESGAVSAGAADPEITHLLGYADHIGTAFQVVDDILNVEGDPDIMGKAAGSDLAASKITFPSLIGLEQSKAYAADLVSAAAASLEIFDEKALPLRKIASYITERTH